MTNQLPLKPKRFLTISQAAQAIGVSPVTLRYWEKKGFVLSERTEGGIRKYRLSVLKAFIQNHPELISKTQNPDRSSIKKIEGHLLITTRFAILSCMSLIILGMALGLNGQYLIRLASRSEPSPTALTSSDSLVKTSLSGRGQPSKNNLSQSLPEIKSFTTAGINVSLPDQNQSQLSDPASFNDTDLDIKTQVPLTIDQEIDCTLI